MKVKKLYVRTAHKRSVDLNANSDLLRRATEEDINLSTGLRAKLEERWLAENKEAIASYNEHIERDGIFGSGTRRF